VPHRAPYVESVAVNSSLEGRSVFVAMATTAHATSVLAASDELFSCETEIAPSLDEIGPARHLRDCNRCDL